MKRSREPEEPLHLQPPPHSPSSYSSASGEATTPAADICLPPAKIVSLDPDQIGSSTAAVSSTASSPAAAVSEEATAAAADFPATVTMACLLHRDRLEFGSYNAYESHYHKEHLNRCLECHRNFPSPYYLGLHADECHDPFVAVKRDKGEHTFACFVEGCERKCGSADKRRRHLIDKHAFPKNFFFAITLYGIDGRHSLLQEGRRHPPHHRRRSSSSVTAANKDGGKPPHPADDHDGKKGDDAAKDGAGASGTPTGPRSPSKAQARVQAQAQQPAQPAPAPSSPREPPDVDMDDLSGALSAMTFVPRSVQFGRGGKVGFARR